MLTPAKYIDIQTRYESLRRDFYISADKTKNILNVPIIDLDIHYYYLMIIQLINYMYPLIYNPHIVNNVQANMLHQRYLSLKDKLNRIDPKIKTLLQRFIDDLDDYHRLMLDKYPGLMPSPVQQQASHSSTKLKRAKNNNNNNKSKSNTKTKTKKSKTTKKSNKSKKRK